MRCSYCGKELPNGVNFCDGCGAKLEVPQMMPNQNEMPNYNNQNMGYYNQNNQNPMYQNNYQPPKKNTGLIFLIVVLAVILIVAIAVGAFFLLSGDDKEKTDDDPEVVEKEDDDDNKKTETLDTGSYILTLPKGYSVSQQSTNGSLISSKECTMYVMEYPLSTSYMVVLKDEFIAQMGEQGYVITSFKEDTILNRDVIIMETTQNGVKCVLLFVDVDDYDTMFFVIASSTGLSIDTDWYEDAVTMVKSAKEK